MKEKETSRKKEHIILLSGGWDIGGVERITRVLADAFVQRGFRVTIAAFKFERRDLLNGIDDRVEICELSYPVRTEENVRKLRAQCRSDEKIFFIHYHPIAQS